MNLELFSHISRANAVLNNRGYLNIAGSVVVHAPDTVFTSLTLEDAVAALERNVRIGQISPADKNYGYPDGSISYSAIGSKANLIRLMSDPDAPALDIVIDPLYSSEVLFKYSPSSRMEASSVLEYVNDSSGNAQVPADERKDRSFSDEVMVLADDIDSFLYRNLPRYNRSTNKIGLESDVPIEYIADCLKGNPDRVYGLLNDVADYNPDMLGSVNHYIEKVQAYRSTVHHADRIVDSPHREDASVGKRGNGDNDAKELSPIDKLRKRLNDGIQNILNSEEYKNFLNTSGKDYLNNYSFRNALLVFLQKPDATHVMSYSAWKDFGRSVMKGAEGAKVFVPEFIRNSKSQTRKIIKSLDALRSDNPNLDFVSYRLGSTNLEFTMNQSGVYGLRNNGKDVAIFHNERDINKFLDSFKEPIGFNVGSVFSQNDVCVPEHLFIKSKIVNGREVAFDKADLVMCDNGNPIRNDRGEYKVVNTPDRIARFKPSLDMSRAAGDAVKMEALYNACAVLCESKGVALQERSVEDDDSLRAGVHGYFSRVSEDPKQYPNGTIAVKADLAITDKVCVLVHEIAHADLHGNLDKLSKELGGGDITRGMKEHQAESVAYGVVSRFGVDSSPSFKYLALYATGFGLEELNKSLDVIHREIKSLTKDLEKALHGLGYDMELNKLEQVDARDNAVGGARAGSDKLMSRDSYLNKIAEIKSSQPLDASKSKQQKKSEPVIA
jgi:hypothetical protein